ncbi:hypothetical protein VTL71DRAFT_7354 [Oculimacula yallundae]|uniref:Phosphotransferase n=1 Tax=Oculimacula yallundae TaxID=86028 RepID=A0ABR4BWI0_9HELO
MYSTRENLDNLIWDKNDEEWEILQPVLRRRGTIDLVEALASNKLGRRATWVTPMNIGGYNIVYRLRMEEPPADVIVRRSIDCYAKFPEEKTSIEVATARYLENSTQIPIAKVLFHGNDPELGCYVIMKYIEHKHSMSAALNATNEDPNKTFILDPNIPEDVLEAMYRKVAHCLLELVQHTFPLIGSLAESIDGTCSIASRPITRNMNDMLQLAGIPRSILPPEDKTYSTAIEYYTELANQHIAQLVFQHNDLVASANDCRNKYVARLIFRRLAKQGKLSSFGFREDDWSAQSKEISLLSPAPLNVGSFPLYCDDLRAANILLDTSDNIAAFIDWEFTYAAPTQFSLDPPWWLVLDAPDSWEGGLDDWVAFYEPRLEIWLQAMRKAEASFDVKQGSGFSGCKLDVPLSTYMRESWETGRFWLSFAARNSWAFDAVYWKFLDEKFFGVRQDEVLKHELWQTRLDMLSEDERNAMESFVERKMEEGKERKIVVWSVEDAKNRLAEMILD